MTFTRHKKDKLRHMCVMIVTKYKSVKIIIKSIRLYALHAVPTNNSFKKYSAAIKKIIVRVLHDHQDGW